jgi:cell division protein ZapA
MTNKQLVVKILEQEYRLICSEDSEAALLESVARVDGEMRRVRENSTVRGTDRIAVMAALSIASQLIDLQTSVRHGEAFPAEEIRRTVETMNQQLGNALTRLSPQH